MKVKLVIQTMVPNPDNDSWGLRRSEIWSGEWEILDENEYLAKLSIIAEGKPQPICDIPFSTGVGHYRWIPPSAEIDLLSDAYSYQEGTDNDSA